MLQKIAGLEANLLLASLTAREQHRLVRRLEAVSLRAADALHELGQPIEYVYFPVKGCLISVVKSLDDGKSFDVSPVGYEGMVGLERLLGSDAQFGAIVRIGGQAFESKEMISMPKCGTGEGTLNLSALTFNSCWWFFLKLPDATLFTRWRRTSAPRC